MSPDPDPAAVAALLQQLQASAEWQKIAPPPEPSPSVAHLLAQLADPPSATPHHPSAISSAPPPPPPDSPPKTCSFQQALPWLSRLGADPAFVLSIQGVRSLLCPCPPISRPQCQLRKEQDTLERQLNADRQAIHQKYAHKASVAKNTYAPFSRLCKLNQLIVPDGAP